MKRKDYSCLMLTAHVLVAETVEEFNALDPARVNACLDEANDNCTLRGAHADIRWEFAKRLEEKTGIRMKREGKVDGKGQPVMKDNVQEEVIVENELPYFKRVLAELGKEASDFQTLMDEVCELKDSDGNYIAQIDPAKKVRAAKDTGPGKRALENADAILAAEVTNPALFTKATSRLKKWCSANETPFELTGDKAKDRVTIATAIVAFDKAQSFMSGVK